MPNSKKIGRRFGLAHANEIKFVVSAPFSTDAQGHEHRGKGPGGGQFTSKGTNGDGKESSGVWAKAKKAASAIWKVFNAGPNVAKWLVEKGGYSSKTAKVAYYIAMAGDYAVPGLPTGSAAVIIAGTIGKPLAPYRAIKALIDKVRGKESAAMGLSDPADKDVVARIAECIENAEDQDWFLNVLAVAIQEEKGDIESALELAKKVVEAEPEPIALSTDAHGREHKGKGPGGGQFTKKNQWDWSDNLPSHKSWKELEADSNYFYHATSKDNVREIQDGVMRPHKPSYGTDQSRWPDGSTAKRIYFSDRPSIAYQFAPEEGKPVLVRIRKNKHIKPEKGTGDYYVEGKRIPPRFLEILTNDGWKFIKVEGKSSSVKQGTLFSKGLGGGDDAVSTNAAFSFDIHNRKAQGILNRAVKASNKISRQAKKEFAAILKKKTGSELGTAIINFVDKYRTEFVNLLKSTNLAALLEGAQDVANKVPPLGSVPVEGLPVAEQDAILDIPPPKPPKLTAPAAGSPEEVHFHIIDAAVKNLAERNVIDRPGYDMLDAAARAKAFTVVNVSSEETLTKIRDSLAGNVQEGVDYETWAKKVIEDVGQGTFMSEAHQENVFRTNVQTAFSDGQMSVLSHPLVRSGFPYSAYDAIHDNRVRKDHLALEKHGIQETNIYRNDDPVFQLFRPPWDYNDRCSWTPITVRHAAERGIDEAKKWLETGEEPTPKAFVKMPPFEPKEGFKRDVMVNMPLSIQLSLQPVLSIDMYKKGKFALRQGKYGTVELSLNDGNRLQLISEVLVAMFGQYAEGQAYRLVDQGNIVLSLALTRRYGRRPGKQWIYGGVSKNGKDIWLHPSHPNLQQVLQQAQAQQPQPQQQQPAPVQPPPQQFTPQVQSTPPPVILRRGGQRARAVSINAYRYAIGKLNAGQQLSDDDKKSLSTKLTNMPISMLRDLFAGLGGTAKISKAKDVVTAVKSILASGTPHLTTAPTKTTLTTPTPTPSLKSTIPYKDVIDWETGKSASGTLNGVEFKPAPKNFWENVKDKDIEEPKPLRRVDRVGVMIQEPDGRIWIVQPTNQFGNRKYTMPGGGVEPGLTNQQNALKEIWEETGLQVEITGYLGDFKDSNNGNNGRLYMGKRVGGQPWDAKIESFIIDHRTGKPAAESSHVTLVTPEKAADLLHRTDDLAQLMTVNPVKINQSTSGKGSEPLKKFMDGIKPAVEAYKKRKRALGHKTGNAELHVVQNMRGFNEKPSVVDKSEMDKLIKKGDHIEMLRGVRGGAGMSAKKIAEEFRTGENFPGHGVFGSGTYCDSNKGSVNVASNYAGQSWGGSGGAVVRMALPKNAKIIKQSELEKAVKRNPTAFTGYYQGNGSARECWQGVQAAMAGYDAIHVDGKSRRHGSYGKGFYIVLNRSILTVQKEDASGHRIQ